MAVEVVTTMTSADVMWQDGSVECNIRSNDLFPVHHLDKILKLCLLTLSQVENGGNYPDNSSKTDKKYPHCFIHQVKYF